MSDRTHRPGRGLAAALLLASAAAAAASPPSIVPWRDPADGALWRGDQFHPTSVHPKRDGSYARAGAYEIDGVRWGFRRVDRPEGTWEATTARTRLEAGEVSRVLLVLNPFSAKASHAAYLFEMPAGGMTRVDTGAGTRGLLISIEGRVRAGGSYSPVKGFIGKYPILYNLAAWEDYVQQCNEIYGSDLWLFELDLDAAERKELLRLTLEETLDDHRDERYHLTRRNCTTILVDWLFQALRGRCGGGSCAHFKRKLLGGLLVHPAMSFPRMLVRALDRRGLIRARLPDLVAGK